METNEIILGTYEVFEKEKVLLCVKSVLGIFMLVWEGQTEIFSFELRSVDHLK